MIDLSYSIISVKFARQKVSHTVIRGERVTKNLRHTFPVHCTEKDQAS